MVYTDYAVAVILLALLIPKPASTPYYEKFEELTEAQVEFAHKNGMKVIPTFKTDHR